MISIRERHIAEARGRVEKEGKGKVWKESGGSRRTGKGKCNGERRKGNRRGGKGPEPGLVGVSGGSHLARLLVHVEGADDALGDLAAGALHQVLSQPVGQVGLARATGAREDEAPVLEQKAYVVLHHRLGDQCLEHQAVDALLLQT